ncbi:hypothetical protein ANRL1_04569 [Anaerolineae bacterium]|nr:hypothetical protein ANRL1_04569 [Anaerolineae bacterium]
MSIYTTGAYIAPMQLLNGKWVWVVSEFEDDTFRDGDLLNLPNANLGDDSYHNAAARIALDENASDVNDAGECILGEPLIKRPDEIDIVTLLNCAEADLIGAVESGYEDSDGAVLKTLKELHAKLVQIEPEHKHAINVTAELEADYEPDAHRRYPGYCAKCGGACYFDDDGKRVVANQGMEDDWDTTLRSIGIDPNKPLTLDDQLEGEE